MAHNHIYPCIAPTRTHELLSILLNSTIQLLIRWPSSWMKPTTPNTADYNSKPSRLVWGLSGVLPEAKFRPAVLTGAK